MKALAQVDELFEPEQSDLESTRLLQSALNQWDSIAELGEIADRLFGEDAVADVQARVRERARNSLHAAQNCKFTKVHTQDEITDAIRLREVLESITDEP